MWIRDSSLADPTASGEQLYYRQWLRLVGSAGFIQDVRVGSFNTGSGAFIQAVAAATTIFSGMPYEVHALISPTDKDRALDTAIKNVRIRSEVPIWAIENGKLYSVGPEIKDVVDVRYFTDPTDSLNLGEHQVDWFKLEKTASGNTLRVSPSLIQSQQLILDAITEVSLGNGDLATVNLPSADWVCAGAAARCFWMLEQDSPGKESSAYKARRQEMAREYTRLSARFEPFISRRIQLDEEY